MAFDSKPSSVVSVRPVFYWTPPQHPEQIDSIVWHRLAWHARGSGRAWPRDSTLAYDLGLTESQVVESITRLWDRDLVTIEFRGERRIIVPVSAPSNPIPNSIQFELKEGKKKQQERPPEANVEPSAETDVVFVPCPAKDTGIVQVMPQVVPQVMPAVAIEDLPAKDMVAVLVSHGVVGGVACNLVSKHGVKAVAIQIYTLKALKLVGRPIQDDARWLVSAITGNWTVPDKVQPSKALEHERTRQAKAEAAPGLLSDAMEGSKVVKAVIDLEADLGRAVAALTSVEAMAIDATIPHEDRAWIASKPLADQHRLWLGWRLDYLRSLGSNPCEMNPAKMSPS